MNINNINIDNINTLVIPDIHGRTFWKNALNMFPKNKYENLHIVFLGDYVDPYDFEHISREDAISNFEDILLTSQNDNRIHLLIGNHDMHYFYDAPYKSRVDRIHYNDIKAMFENHMHMFNVAFDNIINGITYLFTHAGVTSFWLQHLRLMGKIGIDNNKEYRIDRYGNKVKKLPDGRLSFCQLLANMIPTADQLNQLLNNFQGQANLWMASYERGGEYDFGSCIWADLNEWGYENSEIEGIFQVFGHTLIGGGNVDAAVIRPLGKNIAMLDSRQAWCIDNEGNFISVNDLKI